MRNKRIFQCNRANGKGSMVDAEVFVWQSHRKGFVSRSFFSVLDSFKIKCVVGMLFACALFGVATLLSYANDPVILENTTLPLPAPTRYTKDPAVYPMPLAQAGNVCITTAGCAPTYIAVLHGDGSVKAYNTAGGDAASYFPGINTLESQAKAQNASIAQIAAGAGWVAALLTNGKVIYTTNCPAATKTTLNSWSDIVSISVTTVGSTTNTVLALKRDGTVLCTNAAISQGAASLKGIVKIALADHGTCWAVFLTYDGYIKTAGTSAVAPPTTGGFVDIAATGYNTSRGLAALREDGSYYASHSGHAISGLTKGYMVRGGDAHMIIVNQDGQAWSRGHDGTTQTATGIIGGCGLEGSAGTAGALGAGVLWVYEDGKVQWHSNSHIGTVQVELSPIRSTYYSGTYDMILHNHLWTEKAGYTVYYTTDGSDPRTSSTRRAYTGTESAPGLTISRPTTLRAAAYNTATGNFEGGVRTIEWKFNYPTITPSVQPGYFVDPFQLKAEAGGYPIHYTTANREATISDPVLGSSGIKIGDTTTIHMAVEFDGQAVSHGAFTYTKTDTGLIVDNEHFALTTSPNGTISASVPVEKVIAGNLPAILVVSLDNGRTNVCRKVEFITVSQEQQTLTATLTTPSGSIPAGCTAKAYLLQNFATMRPISKVVTQ